jgi:hypothetical protein
VIDNAIRSNLCRSTILVFALISFSQSARSAPFCVEGDGIPAQCVYYDAKQCWQDADRQKGYCSANFSELSLTETDNSICMIDSARVPVCGYQNIQSCQSEAKRRNAVCFQNAGTVASDDPYRLERAPYR